MYKLLLYLQAGRPAVCLSNCLRTGHAASYPPTPPLPVSLFFFKRLNVSDVAHSPFDLSASLTSVCSRFPLFSPFFLLDQVTL